VPEVWPKVERMIAAACEYSLGALNAHEVLDALVRAQWELWLSMWFGDVRACAITHTYKTKRMKLMIIKGIAGEGWEPHFQALTDIARSNGCNHLDAECSRPGWEKRMPKFGFRKAWTTWRIDL
jgi:hypothetical protein